MSDIFELVLTLGVAICITVLGVDQQRGDATIVEELLEAQDLLAESRGVGSEKPDFQKGIVDNACGLVVGDSFLNFIARPVQPQFRRLENRLLVLVEQRFARRERLNIYRTDVPVVRCGDLAQFLFRL